MRAEVQRVEAALAEAHKLENLPSGRFSITYSVDFMSTPMPHLDAGPRHVARLLHAEALLAAAEGKADRAWHSCRAVVNASHTLADEPLFLSQLVRMSLQIMAIKDMERALAQGQASRETLAAGRELFAGLAPENMFLVALRGERAGFYMLMNSLLDGSAQLADLSGKNQATFFDRLSQRFAGNMIRESNIYGLRHFTRAIAAAQLPPVEQANVLLHLEVDLKSGAVTGETPKLASLLVPAYRRVATADTRRRTHLGCAVVALAAEEYRLMHKRWPASTQDLVKAGLLQQVPVDSFDEQPLRWRQTDDGLVIYSIGPNGDYQGESLDDNRPPGEDVRVEFRLWNPERRRQSPPPANNPKRDDQ